MKKEIFDLYPYFNKPEIISFHQKTKISAFIEYKKNKDNKWPIDWVDINYKGYPRLEKTSLPKIKIPKNASFYKTLMRRKSRRKFQKKELSLSKLSTLLYLTAGLRKINGKDSGNRFYPSAGSRYPLEIYPLILKVSQLDAGVYHYHLKTHSLEKIKIGLNIKKQILVYFNQNWITNTAIIFAISAVFWRSEVKYGKRAYVYALLEAGMMTQNFYLVTQALGLKCCSIGGFIDDGLHNLIDLDGEEEAILTTIAVGY
jgi:SagB-type dehydrogenase family enzyme